MKRKILAIALCLSIAAASTVTGYAAKTASERMYADGTYTGTARGMGGDVVVTVSIKEDVITVDEIIGKYETPGVGGKEAIEDGTFKAQIEEAQSAEIEGVAGATMTSGGVQRALKDALGQAMEAYLAMPAECVYADGTYTGTARGMGGDIAVTITVKNDVITVDEIIGKYETPGVGGKEAIEDGTFKAQIEEAQSAEIEGIAGATMTSGGVIKALKAALDEAFKAKLMEKEAPEADTKHVYNDGTYTGTARGMGGDITVTITVKNDVITVDEITGKYETPGVGGKEAIEDGTFKAQIEEAQSAEIEGVAGATMTSGGVQRAVKDALTKAFA